MNKLAPIALFCYKRLEHLKKTIDYLKNNILSQESELFIFSDGWRNENDKENVLKVREFIKNISGFKKIIIIERTNNFGLSKNIIDGVTNIVNEYGKIIVIEDDILTSPYFLKYMNEALIFYEKIDKVMHISGYMYPIDTQGLPDTFFIKPTTCWGWATWKRAWSYFKKDPQNQIKIMSSQDINDFNIDNTYPFWKQVILNHKGKINTWAIFWYLSVYLNNGLSLHPRDSLTLNIGLDGSGENCIKTNIYNSNLSTKTSWVFSMEIQENSIAKKNLKEYFKKIKRNQLLELLKKIFKKNFKILYIMIIW